MSTEDTTAQLREQISSALSYTSAGADCFALADQIMPIVLAQVEAAKATATRDALEQAADDWDGFHDLWSGIQIAAELRARASAQGVAPAEVCGSKHPDYETWCAQDPGHDGPHTMHRGTSANLMWPQRSGGQGAQSSGHRACIYCGFDFNPGLARCPDHIASDQRDPGQPGEQPAEPEIDLQRVPMERHPAGCVCTFHTAANLRAAGDGPGEQPATGGPMSERAYTEAEIRAAYVATAQVGFVRQEAQPVSLCGDLLAELQWAAGPTPQAAPPVDGRCGGVGCPCSDTREAGQ